MNSRVAKEWLVRTRTGEVLGPFTQHELLENMQKHVFTAEDEIAPSGGLWISAQSLNHRDSNDENTYTSTRGDSSESTITQTQTASHSSEMSATPQAERTEEMTPTPISQEDTEEVSLNGKSQNHKTADSENKKEAPKNGIKPIGPLIVGMLVTFSIWTLLVLLKPHRHNVKEAASQTPPTLETDSNFLKHISLLMKTGENQKALRELSAFHKKTVTKESVDHLVPYAALLIIKKESAPRAKKFLETILAKATDPTLKAKAHLWMGYLMLNEGEGDLGENQFLESLQLNPKDPAARFNLGRVYLKQEKYSQSLDYLNLAELEAPDLWLIHIYKGRVKWALGQIEEARQSFKTAVHLSPDRWLSHIYYSLFLLNIKETENAQFILKTMLTKDVNYEIQSPTPLGYFQEKVNYKEYLNAFSQVMAKPLSEEREVGKLYLNYLAHGSDSLEAKRILTMAERGNLTTKIIALKVLLDTDATVEQLKFSLASLPQTS
jgi:tetratricopeptide (TPR) repeat protein